MLPLLAPAVIFGAGAVLAVLDGLDNGALPLLAAFSFAACVLSPFAAAAARAAQSRRLTLMLRAPDANGQHVRPRQSQALHGRERRVPALAGARRAGALAPDFILGFLAPPDYQQGDTVKIMFLHVPAAWTAMMAYGLMAVASLFGLVWRHPLADVAAKAAAPLGALFTALGLITGSLWGRPMWGAYWVWDARLTSFLLLLFLYLGYIALWNAIEDEARAARAAAILALVGAVNLPIIEFSVDWWTRCIRARASCAPAAR